MRTLSTLFLLFLTVSPALADDTDEAENLKEYDVEIIIFEDAHARYLTSQSWNQNANTTEQLTDSAGPAKVTKNRDKLSISEIKTSSFKPVKPVILRKQYNGINASSEYKILFYGAWRQAGLEKSKAFEINLSELKNSHRVRSKNTLTGNFKVVLARYLHFYSQLEYQRQSDQQKTNEISADGTSDITAENITPGVNQTDVLTVDNNIYPMQSHRRMRSKELHYIDHPLVGMLIQINPVKKPEKEL